MDDLKSFLFISFLLFYYLRQFSPYTLPDLMGHQNIGIGIFLLFFVIFFFPLLLKKRIQILPENFKIFFLITMFMLFLYGAHIKMAMLIFPFVLLYLTLRYLAEKDYALIRGLSISITLIFLMFFSLQYYGIYRSYHRTLRQQRILVLCSLDFCRIRANLPQYRLFEHVPVELSYRG